MVFPSAPCAPTNVTASLVCENNTAAVSWQHSPGAISYKVVANGRDGDLKQCTTNSTSCHLPNMHCAQTYVITVTPYSAVCKGLDSNPHAYVAGKVDTVSSRIIGFNKKKLFFTVVVLTFNEMHVRNAFLKNLILWWQ